MSPSYQNEGMSGRHGTGYIDSDPYRSTTAGARESMSGGRGIAGGNRTSGNFDRGHTCDTGDRRGSFDTGKRGSTFDTSGRGDNVGRVFRGAGEKLRGDINSTLDGLGEDVAGRGDKHARPKTMSDRGERPECVAHKGEREMDRGWKHFDNAF